MRIASDDVRTRLEADGLEFDEQAELVARTIGVGAVKYADLSLNRESNYRFSYAKVSRQAQNNDLNGKAIHRTQGLLPAPCRLLSLHCLASRHPTF